MQLIHTLIEPLGWTLLHFVWQGLFVGLVHELALLATSRRSPQVRYAISLAALFAVLAAPLLTFAWLAFETAAPVPLLGSNVELPVGAVLAANAAAFTQPFVQSVESGLPYVVVLWMLGVTALSLRFGIGLYSLRHLAACADYDAVSDWMKDELARLVRHMGITRPVRIALSTRVSSPLVVGWLRPIIFLPLSAATGLDHHQIRMVLAHELAHLRRHDHFVNFVQVVAETVLFYHPVVHRISRSLRQEREQCCDDMAAEISGNALAYARVLAQLEEMRQREKRHVLALGIAEQELYVRIQRLVGTPSRTGPDRWLPMMVLALAAVLALTRTPDFDAPLLPEFLSPVNERVQIGLDLPAVTSRPYRPIGGEDAELARPDTGEARPAVSRDIPAAETATTSPVAQAGKADMKAEAGKDQTGTTKSAAATVKPSAPRVEAADEPVPARSDNAPVLTGGALLHAAEPVYPRRALRVGTEGRVLMEFTITAEGNVVDAAVVEAEPRGLFDSAALQAIRQWQYQPFSRDGVPVARRASQVLEFRLHAEPVRRGGTSSAGECQEQTGTRLCRANQAGTTELRVLND